MRLKSRLHLHRQSSVDVSSGCLERVAGQRSKRNGLLISPCQSSGASTRSGQLQTHCPRFAAVLVQQEQLPGGYPSGSVNPCPSASVRVTLPKDSPTLDDEASALEEFRMTGGMLESAWDGMRQEIGQSLVGFEDWKPVGLPSALPHSMAPEL